MVESARQKAPIDPPIRKPGAGETPEPSSLTPKEIVAELDRYIIGQEDAKRAVAVALRNRYRRQQLPEELRREVSPRNILMIGSTGVGKTEIARRVARIVDAPFIKVEATKFTEVGYVGRDVESIVRDLVEIAVSMLHGERLDAVREQAAHLAVEHIAELLADESMAKSDRRSQKTSGANGEQDDAAARRAEAAVERRYRKERDRLLALLRENAMEDETVEIEVEDDEGGDAGSFDFAGMSADDLHDSFMEFLDGLMPRRRVRRRVPVREARRILTQEEAYRMVDVESVIDDAIQRVEQAAVVFIDEIDKIVASDEGGGPDVSGEGVQRDLLPIIEGSTVMTRYGPVQTDHILFIAAGAFHQSRPSDLIPELQGRFPIRVELQALSEQDLHAILTEPKNALSRQYLAMLETEGVTLEFTDDGLHAVAQLAMLVNQRTEDIGARRLQTIMEKVLEDVSFDAPDLAGQTVTINETYVIDRVGDVAVDDELSNFIL
ncbi:MAG TPA: ATP-dependent protease ATPase subunit HslU [Thermomicrobiales bacterium]|nr:ATP-dependent protease ATPase subunit HslU [Thermomicrobiales bacterium]